MVEDVRAIALSILEGVRQDRHSHCLWAAINFGVTSDAIRIEQPDSLVLRLEGFEGPLDLLLDLARSGITSAATPSGQQTPAQGDPSATKVGYAISLINRGSRNAALREIDQVLASAGGDPSDAAQRTSQ